MMSLADPDPRFRNASRVVRHKCSTPNKCFWRRTTLSSWDLPFCFIELPCSCQMPFRWRSSVGFDLRNLRTCENISILESPHFQNLTRKKTSKHGSLSAEHLEARTLHVVGVSAVALEASHPESRTGRLPHNFPPWLEMAGRWVIWVIWVAGVGWLRIWQTLAVALDVRSNAGFDMAWLLLMPGCEFWFFWCYCDWSILGLIHIAKIQHVYLTIILSAKIGKLLCLYTIEIYWTTDSSWKNAALATKLLHPNSSSV